MFFFIVIELWLTSLKKIENNKTQGDKKILKNNKRNSQAFL